MKELTELRVKEIEDNNKSNLRSYLGNKVIAFLNTEDKRKMWKGKKTEFLLSEIKESKSNFTNSKLRDRLISDLDKVKIITDKNKVIRDTDKKIIGFVIEYK